MTNHDNGYQTCLTTDDPFSQRKATPNADDVTRATAIVLCPEHQQTDNVTIILSKCEIITVTMIIVGQLLQGVR